MAGGMYQDFGKGFTVTRQKRITFDGRHFRIDLVFYNYILKCFVLIDLKVNEEQMDTLASINLSAVSVLPGGDM